MSDQFNFDELALSKLDIEDEIRDVKPRVHEAREANTVGDFVRADILLNDYRPVSKYLASLRSQLEIVEQRIAEREAQG